MKIFAAESTTSAWSQVSQYFIKYILLRIVFELIIQILETKSNLAIHFCSTFTVDILLKIYEDYQDSDLKISAIETLSCLCKSDGAKEIISLFRKLGGP